MKFIRLLLLGISASSVMPVAAQDYAFISLKGKDGVEYLVAADGFQLDYSDGRVVVTGTGVAENTPLTLSLSDLELMRFANSSASADLTPVDILPAGIEVFSLAGIRIGSFASSDEARAALPSGYYILKTASGAKVVAL